MAPDSVTSGELNSDDLRAIVDKAVSSMTGDLGSTRFPRSVLESIASSGVLRRRWPADGGSAGDVEFGVRLGRELATRMPPGVDSGVSVHAETVLSMLHRFGTSDYLGQLREAALAGNKIGCVA